VITRYAGPFDVIFIDVEKEQYPQALDLARVRVRPGGFIVTDNVLWSGRVAEPESTWDERTRAIDRYNRVAAEAPDLLTTILPLRDGVAVHYKLGETPRRIRSASSPGIPAVRRPTPVQGVPPVVKPKK
jgi:predicted O-methyltransferase YrrM